MMPAIQAPPVPPVPPPGSELSIGGSLEGIAAIVLLLGASLIMAALIWPLVRAFAKRIEGTAPTAEMQTELDSLRERVRQLEEIAPRMSELEERVDFTERIVAQGREPDRLQR
jgi:uncharacterized protein Yka (UPF0111/DUF47 family)